MPKRSTKGALDSWADLNKFLLDADEGECVQLSSEERRGRRRQQFLLRIHSRFNKVRAENERLRIKEDVS